MRKTFSTKLSNSAEFRITPLCDDILTATSYLPESYGVPFRIKCIFSDISCVPKCPVCGKECGLRGRSLVAGYECFAKTCGNVSCQAKYAAGFIVMTDDVKAAHSNAQLAHKDKVRKTYSSLVKMYVNRSFMSAALPDMKAFCLKKLNERTRNGKIIREHDFSENPDMLCSIIAETSAFIPINVDLLSDDIDMSEFNFNERIYCIIHGVREKQVCKYCQRNAVDFINANVGYAQSCPNCQADKCREKKGQKTTKQILSDISADKYEILCFPEKPGRDPLVVKCRKCGYVSTWWSGNGFLQSLSGKALCKNCETFESQAERDVAEFMRSLGFDVLRNDRTLISPRELDIVVENKNIAIEFDGFYYHSDERLKPSYHLDKTKLSNKAGLDLVHVFENEWVFKRAAVENELAIMLCKYEPAYKTVGQTCLREITFDEYIRFVKINSVGMPKQPESPVYYGMFDDNCIVSAMISSNRYRREYDISGICVKIGYDRDLVALLMLRQFESVLMPSVLRLFFDRRYTVPGFVAKLGCEFAHNTKIRGWWFPSGNFNHEFDIILDDRTQVQADTMSANGYSRIFDCGNLVFVKRYESVAKK